MNAAVWVECEVASCDAETLASRAAGFGWQVHEGETLCSRHAYLSLYRPDTYDVRALAAGEGRA